MYINFRENNIWTVYIHIIPKCLSGYEYDKYYVGITSQEPCRRWENGSGYYKQFFERAIQKYGWNNIEHYIVAEHLTENEAQSFEIKLIAALKSNNRLYGYNRTSGGEGAHDVEYDDNFRELKRQQNLGSKNPFYNHHHTEETKKLLSEKLRNNPKIKQGSSPRRIHQFTPDKQYVATYNNIQEAGKAVNASGRIGDSARSKEHFVSMGFLWAFDEDVVNINGVLYLNPNYKIKESKIREVYQFDINNSFIKKYNSCREAAQEYHVGTTTIYSVIKGYSQRSRDGSKWVYEDSVIFKNGTYYLKEAK